MLRLFAARGLELGFGVRCHRRRRRGARVLRVCVHLVVGGGGSPGRARRGVRSALLGARGLRRGSQMVALGLLGTRLRGPQRLRSDTKRACAGFCCVSRLRLCARSAGERGRHTQSCGFRLLPAHRRGLELRAPPLRSRAGRRDRAGSLAHPRGHRRHEGLRRPHRRRLYGDRLHRDDCGGHRQRRPERPDRQHMQADRQKYAGWQALHHGPNVLAHHPIDRSKRHGRPTRPSTRALRHRDYTRTTASRREACTRSRAQTN
jgi:hypothetical protein